ncbi:site-specific integrase [uncultured Zoogloea sp.]|uniref:tyrosine-type recombinase/integrase n=1 Tax=uncultured Zoogloea sp. TaxID=160237 RepID=UPI002604F3FA|nr:site-specific integrase [uncultured Zoogloea sp.]
MTATLNFTKTALEALPLPAAGARVEYQDSKTPGLRLRVTSSGVKTFCIFKRTKGGQPERITLGRFPELTVELARKEAAKVLATIASGANPAETKRALRAEHTFGDLFQQYMERHARPRKATANEDEQRYTQYLLKPLGSKRLSQVTRQQIATIHSDITRDGHPAVANRVLALVSSVFGRGVEWGITQVNPALGIRRNPEKSRDRFLQTDELPRFFAALEEETNPMLRDFFLVALLTGARRANVLAMRWDEVSLSEGVWRVPNTKNNTPQNVPLTGEVLRILKERKANSTASEAEFVFPGTGKTGHLVEPRKGWERVLERAGLQNLRIHDLRRTLGSWQAKTGASLTVIGKSLNHKSHLTTTIYARLDMDPVRDSVEKATEAMLQAGKKAAK